jgi:hypothetical protein
VKYRDLMRQLRAGGWEIVAIRGSHRQLKKTVARMRAAIALHLDGPRTDGEPIPEPVTSAELVAA